MVETRLKTGAEMTSVKFTSWIGLPVLLVPTTRIVYVPGAAVADVTMFSVDVPVVVVLLSTIGLVLSDVVMSAVWFAVSVIVPLNV